MSQTVPLRAALYLRVSTNDQTTDNQVAPLREEAARRRWVISDKVYSDAGISGAKGRDKRPGLDMLLRDAARGKFDVVMVWSLDRLGRSLSDLITTLADLHKSDVDLFLQQQQIDTTTPAGKAMFGLLGVFAEFERSMIVSRVHAGLDRARAQGKVLGRPGIDMDMKARIVGLLAGGMGINKIAARLKTGSSTVQRVKKEMGVSDNG
jgi:DNA invertase Pin-like site-specific DNA recombinase